jgi:hypothetical protein
MIKLERDPERLVLQSGPSTVVLDKVASRATWVSTTIDDESRAEISSLTLVMHHGDGWVLAAADKLDATAAATALRDFLGIAE